MSILIDQEWLQKLADTLSASLPEPIVIQGQTPGTGPAAFIVSVISTSQMAERALNTVVTAVHAFGKVDYITMTDPIAGARVALSAVDGRACRVICQHEIKYDRDMLRFTVAFR